MDMDAVRALAGIVREFGLNVLEVDGERVRIERGPLVVPLQDAASQEREPLPAAAESAPAVQTPPAAPVRAPLLGVFYASPAPGQPPFAQVGDRVKKGDTLCIIEAMKLMNEISADRDGTILEVCAQNGQVVEYGQTLFQLTIDN